MLNEEELIKRFKNNPQYINAMEKLSAEDAAIVERNVLGAYQQMINNLKPFLDKCVSDPEFLSGIQMELDRQASVFTKDTKDKDVIISEKNGQNLNA